MAHSFETPIAIGELIDRITILEIKVERFTDAAMTRNAQAELSMLRERRDQAIPQSPTLDALTVQLRAINQRLWDLEDRIRDCERRADFGPDFIAVARSIYRTNDKRAAVKRQISIGFGSDLIEEKSYAPY
jgi:Family of unknown function (DUF6165)